MRFILLLLLCSMFMPVFGQDVTIEQISDQTSDKSKNDLDDIAKIVALIVSILAIATAAKGVFEYTVESKRKRAAQFIEMRKKFKENDTLMAMCDLLENDETELQNQSYKNKKYFLGFYEEVALLVNSKLMKKEIAHYMFGYYAIKCFNSKNFWASGVNKQSPYWSTFIKFAEIMVKIDKEFDKSKEIRL